MKKQNKIKRPMDISNGIRMNWLMKKTGCKKSRETVPLSYPLLSSMQNMYHCGGTGTDSTTYTDQHRTGTDNYRYSNGQQLGVYWLIRGAKWIYIQDRWIVSTGQVNCEHRPVNHPRGWNAGLTDPRPMWGGGLEGEVQVTSVETHGQPDAGWRNQISLL